MKSIIVHLFMLIILVILAACQNEQDSVITVQPSAIVSSPTSIPTSAPLLPTVTITPIPSQTSGPIVTPELAPSIRLSEDFSGEFTCVETFDNNAARGRIEDASYFLEIRNANEIINANCETLVVGNLDLEVDVSLLSVPPEGAYYFGVVFRVSGFERYAFVIGSEGTYCSYYANNEFFIPLTNSTDYEIGCWARLPESAMAEGRQHLRVVALEDRFDFYLNGILLGVVRDNKLREGWVGLVAATADEGGLIVAFDNLRVARP
ncbi:MAG: hypothetical protein FVQ83_09675 [Chloroflexi bacterium]|nr:hypothetical protein [Chloroflexota bacterium]